MYSVCCAVRTAQLIADETAEVADRGGGGGGISRVRGEQNNKGRLLRG